MDLTKTLLSLFNKGLTTTRKKPWQNGQTNYEKHEPVITPLWTNGKYGNYVRAKHGSLK